MISDGVRPLLKNGMGGALILQIAFHEMFPIFQEFLDVSQKAMAFHKISPTLFIEIGYCSFSNAV